MRQLRSSSLVPPGFVVEHAERVRGFDMFPQTPHVETVALLTRSVPA